MRKRFRCMRVESFEPFNSSVKGGHEGAFRCYYSINSKPSQRQHGHRYFSYRWIIKSLTRADIYYDKDAVKRIHPTFGCWGGGKIVAGDDLLNCAQILSIWI